MVYSDGEQDLYACKRACTTEFRPRIVNLFMLEQNHTDYEGLELFWSTCQYRCYRCNLSNAIVLMRQLKDMFDYNTAGSSYAILEITKLMVGIDSNLKICYDSWRVANNNGDITSEFE
ncbi:hypothetical protein HPULCUR_011025 [Helicostylum pulchrum]|uniref:Uncharacterized protein n=1 Tax=Helicostylum pulchrum TaxID=562976 RepID=A0ABP9YG02_9FUNG